MIVVFFTTVPVTKCDHGTEDCCAQHRCRLGTFGTALPRSEFFASEQIKGCNVHATGPTVPLPTGNWIIRDVFLLFNLSQSSPRTAVNWSKTTIWINGGVPSFHLDIHFFVEQPSFRFGRMANLGFKTIQTAGVANTAKQQDVISIMKTPKSNLPLFFHKGTLAVPTCHAFWFYAVNHEHLIIILGEPGWITIPQKEKIVIFSVGFFRPHSQVQKKLSPPLPRWN